MQQSQRLRKECPEEEHRFFYKDHSFHRETEEDSTQTAVWAANTRRGVIYVTGLKTASVEITFIHVFIVVDMRFLYFLVLFTSLGFSNNNNNNVCSWKIKE